MKVSFPPTLSSSFLVWKRLCVGYFFLLHVATNTKTIQTLFAEDEGAGDVGGDAGDKDTEDYLANIEAAKKAEPQGTEFSYTSRDVILYSTPPPFPSPSGPQSPNPSIHHTN